MAGLKEHMQCPFLEGKRILSCRSLGAVYIPSTFELDTYCMRGGHKKCHLYCTSPRDKMCTDTVKSDVIKPKGKPKGS